MRIFKNGGIQVLFSILLLVTVTYAQSLSFSGYVRNYTGILTEGVHDYAIVQNTFDINIEQNLGRTAFKVNPYIYQYPDETPELNLREAWLDIYFRSVDLRIGKQQIIWGKADGVFITDIVSPKDLSEFLLRDFAEIRMGITALKADYYRGDDTFEFVWVPVFTPTLMPEENSIWYPKVEFPPSAVFDYSGNTVEPEFGNGELFARFSAMTSLIDYELMGGYMWDDDPVMHIYTDQDSGEITVSPSYHRLSVGGGSFSSTLGSLILRGEAAYYGGKYFSATGSGLVDGTIRKDYLHYLLGMDYSLWDTRLSVQFVQQAVLDYDSRINNDEFTNTMTFMASRDFLRETLRVELFSYLGLNDKDALVRPKVTFSPVDGLGLIFGCNIFVGDEGRFGQYDENDMIYTKIKYSF